MEEYYQADTKGRDDRTKKKKSSSGERERRMAEEMAGGGGTDSGAPVRPSRRVVAEEAGPVRVPAEQPVYARERRSSRDVRRDEPGAGDVRASSSSAIQASADPKDTRTGVDELNRTARKSSKRVSEVSGLETASARAASTPEPLARPSSARRRVDLAPSRATPEPSGPIGSSSSSSRAAVPDASYQSSQSAMMSAAMDAEAAARADALQREKRLQEKREKRRMLMEKEAIGLARNKQDDVSSAGVSSLPPVSLDVPVRQEPQVAVDFLPKKKHSPKPSPKASAKSVGDGDGYDDDFETYSGDEFEAEPDADEKQEDKPHKQKDAPPAKSEPAVERRSAGSKATSSNKAPASSAAPSARKGVFTSCWSSVPVDGPKADVHGSNAASKLASALHPRAQRVKQLQSLVPLEVERFVDLNLQPVAPYELYQRRLRATSTNTKGSSSTGSGSGEGIHQSGTQTNDDARSLDVQTEDITMADKQMQFYLSDDTDFLDALKKAAATREGKPAKKDVPVDVPLDAASVNRLMGFLQRASPVCETLLEENLSQVRKAGDREEVDRLPESSTSKDDSIFKRDSNWVTILTVLSGSGGSSRRKEGKEEEREPAAPSQGGWMGLLADRPLLEVHSNGQQPHIVMSVHGPKPFVAPAPVKEKKSSKKSGAAPVDMRNEAMARRCIVALWDAKLLAVGRATGPSKLLCCEGLLSVTCFGPGMLSVVVAGTDTGVLHLWDLREPKDAHVTPWCLENNIPMGLRPPTYSTLGSGGVGHVSRIVTITPFSSEGGGSTTFQLASLDDRGILTLWMVNEVGREGLGGRGGGHHVEDAGLTLGGKLRLSRSRSLDVFGKNSTPASDGPRHGTKGGLERQGRVGDAWAPRGSLREVNWDLNICDMGELELGPGAVTLAFFPKDPNRFLVGLTSGVVLHCSRFGTAKAPKAFERAGAHWGSKKNNKGMGLGADSLFPPSPATAIHFSPFLPDHFLVAYADGVFCLFVASYAEPLRHWDAAAVAPPLPPSKQFGWALSQEVSWISWSPHRPFVFYALLGRRGLLLAFDLSRSDRAPILNEALCKDDGAGGEDEEGRLCVLSMSAEKTGQIAAGNVPYLVMASQQGVRFRQLRKGLYSAEADEVSRMKTYLDGVI